MAADFEQDIDAGKIVTAEEDKPTRTIPVTCTSVMDGFSGMGNCEMAATSPVAGA